LQLSSVISLKSILNLEKGPAFLQKLFCEKTAEKALQDFLVCNASFFALFFILKPCVPQQATIES